MRPAFEWIAPLSGITWALDIVTATAVTTAAAVVNGDHVIPKEVILTADATGFAPGGGPIHMTHCDHNHPNDATIGHNPAKGIDLTTGVGVDPQEDILAINPILQIINVSGVLRSINTVP